MVTPTESLMSDLPYLRRYARALTGSVTRGDGLLTRAVEAALASPEPTPSRLTLYRLLGTLSDADPALRIARLPATPTHPLEAALAALDETDRRLYLLTSLEELSAADAAAVLGLTEEEAHHRLTGARTAVAGRLTAHVLVVEDNAIIAIDLAETVRGMGHTVCGTAATLDQAMALLEREPPTLALLDVRLAQGGSGIDIARTLRRHHHVPVIFVTAFPEDLNGQGLESLGPVIAKPFTRDQIQQAITRAVFAVPGEPPPATGTPRTARPT